MLCVCVDVRLSLHAAYNLEGVLSIVSMFDYCVSLDVFIHICV